MYFELWRFKKFQLWAEMEISIFSPSCIIFSTIAIFGMTFFTLLLKI